LIKIKKYTSQLAKYNHAIKKGEKNIESKIIRYIRRRGEISNEHSGVLIKHNLINNTLIYQFQNAMQRTDKRINTDSHGTTNDPFSNNCQRLQYLEYTFSRQPLLSIKNISAFAHPLNS